MQPLLVVPHADIDVSGTSLEAELPTRWLDAQLVEAEAQAVSPGQVSVRLSSSGRDVVVRGDVHAHLRVPCARCLGPAELEVHGELSLLLQPRASHDHAGTTRGSAGGTRGASGRSSARAAGEGAKPAARGAAARAKESAPAVATPKRGPGKAGAGKSQAEPSKSASTKAALAEYEFSAEEAQLDEYDGERVVLDAFVREAILLELPSFPLCSESCPGIDAPPHVGHVPAAEPSAPGRSNPFEALRQLLPDGGGAEPAPPRPSSRALSKAAKASQKAKPRIRASLALRNKK